MGELKGDIRGLKVDAQSTQLIDFHGRRITNASPSVDPNDYVTRQELLDALETVGQVVKQNNVSISNTTTLTATAIVDIHTVTANLNITASVFPAPVNGILVVVLVQNVTGNFTYTWDLTHFVTFPGDLNIKPNRISVAIFAAYLGQWMLASAPATGY